MNFDVVAHETAHLILLGVLGFPEISGPTPDFLAYHETAADFVALLSLLHFDSALDKILRRTKGNLLVANELDRLAELMDEKQIRSASHSLKVGNVGPEIHDQSRPFTGALFDSLIDIFQVILVERGLASIDVRKVADIRSELRQVEIDAGFSIERRDYEFRHFAFKAALQQARDIVGEILTLSWTLMEPDEFSFQGAADSLILAAEAGRGRQFADRIFDNLRWRGILN